MRLLILSLLVLIVVGTRLLPHPPNFTPIMAVALFCGVFLKGRWWAYLLPIGALVISDAFLGFHFLSGVVYLSMVPVVLLGSFLGQEISPFGEKKSFFGFRWFGLGLIGDLIFFLASNFGVWALTDYYEHTGKGLLNCYLLALPFLKNQIFGTMTFLGLLLFTWYGLMILAGWKTPELQFQRAPRD